jgi:hypothetical protein
LSWQEELRKLDGELAAGRISADEYRTRRDGLLSSAVTSGSPASAAQAPSQSETTQFIPPIGGGPQPQAGPDRTQVVGGPPGERTQIVTSNDMGADRTQVARPGPPGGEPERTQYVTGYSQPPPPPYGQMPPNSGGFPAQPNSGGFPAQQPDQFGWNTPEGNSGSLWGGSELTGTPTWARTGPEVFDETSTKRRSKKPLIIVAVIVLVAALGVGAYFVFFKDKGSPAQAGTSTSTTPPPPSVTEPPPKDELAIAELPGGSGPKPDIKTFADIEQAGTLTAAENKVYKTANAGNAKMVTATLPDGINVLIMTTEIPTDAAKVNSGLIKLQTEFGMKAYAGTLPNGVKAHQIAKTKDNPAAIRAHYLHGNTVVRVQAAGPDLAQISKAFDEILAAQLEALPVDG